MNLEKVLKFLTSELEKEKINFAVIGGLAGNTVGVVRSTIDVDFLVPLDKHATIDSIMTNYGYERHHKTENVANYSHPLAELGQVDFLFAHRKYSLSMLERAQEKKVFGVNVKVIRAEDLIGFKIQSSSNDPLRYSRDMGDIIQIIQANRKQLDWDLVREYFKLFKIEEDLNKILKELDETN